MRAAQINDYGDPSAVTINNINTPEPGTGQVQVEVYVSSLNPFDTMVRAGYLKDSIPLQLPFTLGGDIAGVVSAVASDVTNFKVGDKVYGQANVVAGNSGAFAEFAATRASQIALAPNNLDFRQAASLPLVGASALQALTVHLQLEADQKIFIQGGAGGIGSIAIQVAKHLGAHVATTATDADIELVKKLGADEVIDYKTTDFADTLHDYDAAFDTVGGDGFNTMLKILKPGGNAVSMTASADVSLVEQLGVNATTQNTHVSTEALDQLRTLVEDGVITTRIGKVFALEQISEAFGARESGDVKGKIVIAIKQLSV